ncbi:CamS family sex pheromone protein, partial [Lacticaseibacillus saniviri]
MKKIFTTGLMIGLVVLLSACGKLGSDSDSTTTSGSKSGSYQTTGAVNNDMYQGVIKNGTYQTSSARGLTIEQNNQGSNTFNIKSMESGLLELSKQQFNTNKYVFQEG